MTDRTCSVEDCDKTRWARGWCTNHYQLWRRNGAPGRVKGTRSCSVDGCDRPHGSRGYCNGHYARWQATGEAGTTALRAARRPVVNGRKQCSACDEWKPIDAYSKSPSGAGGVATKCRLCAAEASRAWFAANPDYRAAWRSSNAQLVLDGVHRRRAARASTPHEAIDHAVVFERDGFMCRLCDEPLDMAAASGSPLSPTLDHVVPISRGGGHVWGNVQAAHFYCNVSKGNRLAPLTRPS